MLINRAKTLGALASVVVMLGAGAAHAATPAEKGKALFAQCSICHANVAGAAPKMGPNLSGVFGRKSASLAGFNYSPAFKKANVVWNEANLDKWLAAPMKMVPGTMMAFAGLSNPDDRKAVIAYLKANKP